ncbi:hypothetical protein JMJ77_0007313 [Colletotrichum scovillei]|uniref:Uncharacterized protein n=1 Tax=Colletotrichum scovillei TaxID=1209932 RepID=A0A9P7REU2_9PEZI|nr:hypothetical protein JMJ77_0007313 [Colletotrichum scovillei]KAG7074316.1 hypothetical protein JMJ76_0010799 [Colletotrichum scovillei]KAG7081023.1 hypothetical protein JMJ78_0003155 [Colletotrichum scovillei]
MSRPVVAGSRYPPTDRRDEMKRNYPFATGYP